MSPDLRIGRRQPGAASIDALRAVCVAFMCLISLATPCSAAAFPPEQLLPEDTLILLTTPDFTKLRQLCAASPRGQLWSDPAMKPLKEKFLSRWREEFVKPLERELDLSLNSVGWLPQGQVTFAVTKSARRKDEDRTFGFLFLMDTRDQSGLLRTNLAELRKKWVATGRTLKSQRIRRIELSIFPVTTNDMPKTLSKFLWRQPVFAPVSAGPDMRQAPVKPSTKGDDLLDTLRLVLTASQELVVGQVDSTLVVGNSVPLVERVVNRLTGGSTPTLGGLAAYQDSHQTLFRAAPLYGWVNVKAFVEALTRAPTETGLADNGDTLDTVRPDKLISATGLTGCRTLAFALRYSDQGSLFQLFLNVPDSTRQGVFRIAGGAPRDANPPSFVPADVASFLRWRTDCPGACGTLQKILEASSPQTLSVLNLILETANARARRDDPGFDLKQTLLVNLGDDVIWYEKAPRGTTAAELQAAPSLFLLGSPDPARLAVALKRLFVIFPQGDTPAEREFLGRRIFSVPLPAIPFLPTGASRFGAPRTLSWTASAGYVALSTDTSLLEELLRSTESQAKTLRSKPGLLGAAQKVGGMGTGIFGYEDEKESMRVAFEAAKRDSGSSTNGQGPNLLPGLPGISGPEASLNEWVDYSLLPAFDRVSRYFDFLVWAGSASTEGLTLKVFAPLPSALRSNALVTAPLD